MAKPTKSKDTLEVSADEIADAVVIEEPDPSADQEAVPEAVPEAEAETVVWDEVAEDAPEDTSEPEYIDTEPAPMAQQPAPVIERRGGFMPVFLGGVAAAVIGFGVARFVVPEGWPFAVGANDAVQAQLEKAMSDQNAARGALADRIAALEAGPDLSAVTGSLDKAQQELTDLSARIDDVSAGVDALKSRLDSVEARPITEGASKEAVAAYEKELAALQEAMARQRAEIEAVASDAAAKKASAEMTEREAMLRGSVTRIRIAMDDGSSYAEEVTNLRDAGVSVPAALVEFAQDGVVTLPGLQASFADAARAALASSRAAGTSEGVGGFLTNLLGARSLEPREGNDPDAVLSRADAALSEGRLTDCLAELEALPEAGRVELTAWMAKASERSAALAALETLTQDLNKN